MDYLNTTLTNIFNFLRHTFDDQPRLLKRIGPAYEKTVRHELKAIPASAIPEAARYVKLSLNLFASIDYGKLYARMKADKFSGMEVSTKEMVKGMLPDTMDYRRVVLALIDTLNPIFDCLDTVFIDPMVYLKRISEMRDGSARDVDQMFRP